MRDGCQPVSFSRRHHPRTHTLDNQPTQLFPPHTRCRTIPNGHLAGVHALPTALDAAGLQALIRATDPSSSFIHPPTPFAEAGTIETLAALRHCLGTAVGRATFPPEAAGHLLLGCFLLPQTEGGGTSGCLSTVPIATRLAGIQLAHTILPLLLPASLEVPEGGGGGGLVRALLAGVGRAFDVWGDYLLDHGGQSRRATAQQAARETAELALAQLALLRSVAAASDAWADCVAGAVLKSLAAAPAVVAALSSCSSSGTGVDVAALDGLMAALCLLGGDFRAPHVGAEVVYAVTRPALVGASATPSSSSPTVVERGRGVVLQVRCACMH
jgi:hypothetical protein